MIETLIRQYIAGNTSLPVYLEEPEDKPPEYILIQKTGMSIEERKVCESSFAVQTFGISKYTAARISYDVLNFMLEIDSLPEVTNIDVNSGPYDFTDSQTHRYRYQTIYDIAHYL